MFGTHKNEWKNSNFYRYGELHKIWKKIPVQKPATKSMYSVWLHQWTATFIVLFFTFSSDSFGILVVLAMDLILSFSRWLSSYFNNIYCNIHLFLSDLRGHLCYKLNFHTDLGLGNRTNERELSIRVSQSVQLLSHVWLFVAPWTAACQASVHHKLPELAQTHGHWVGDAIQLSHPLLSPSPPAFSLSQQQGLS